MGINLFKFLGALMAVLNLAQVADSAAKKMGAPNWLRVLGTGGFGAYNVKSEMDAEAQAEAQAETQRPREPYQRSTFMPQQGQDPMARYAPQNRQRQSGVSPDIMAYLRRYVR